ncbi:MAG TPA: hypothetical protein VG826_28650 [Pirellulales bacterium]|nr:hypothetical protein [Pirellulales bacterium]
MPRVVNALPSCLCIHLSLMTALVAAQGTTQPRPLPTEGETKILAALGQMTTVDFNENPLDAVIDFLKQQHKIDIQLDNKALSDAGIGSDTPLTLKLQSITLRSALRLMLGQLDLTYVAADGYLLITSKTEAENMLRVKVYPVRDLVTLDSEFRPPQPPDQRNREDYQSLIELITTTIAPTAWDEVGGPGSMQGYAHSHSITFAQMDEVHDEALELLTALRRVRDEQIAAAKGMPGALQPPAGQEGYCVRVYRLVPLPARSTWPFNVGGLGLGGTGGGTGGGMGGMGGAMGGMAGGTGGGMGGMFMVDDDGVSQNPDSASPPSNKSTPPQGDPKSASQPPSAAAGAEWDERLLDKWVKELARELPELVEPGAWGADGEGSVRALAGAIVVRQKPEVQQKVADFLAEILPGRVVTSAPAPKPPVRLHAPGAQLDWPHEAAPRAVASEARIEQALAKKCEAEFREEALVKAIDTLAAQGPIQVWLDNKALSDAGVGTDAPVTRSIHGLTLRTAFKLLLGELDLTYVIRNEVFIVTSKTEAENLLVTKVYPVFDLVAAGPGDSRGEPRLGFRLVGVSPVNAGQSAGLDFTSLTSDITANIAPTTWDSVGGPGSIQPFVNSGAVVISQTTEVHEQIADHLKALREVAVAQK